MVGNDAALSLTAHAEKKRQLGSPDAPGRPDYPRNCDLAAMEERLLHVVYSEDDWADTNWVGNEATGNVNILTYKQKHVAKWCGGKATTTISHMAHPYLRNDIGGNVGILPNRSGETRDRRRHQKIRGCAKCTNRIERPS